jgi:hypothetical protein
MKGALFVQANVAVNTILTSKVPLRKLRKFVLKKSSVHVGIRKFKKMYYSKHELKHFSPAAPTPPVANILGGNFLGALFIIRKCSWKPVAPNLLMLPTPLSPRLCFDHFSAAV